MHGCGVRDFGCVSKKIPHKILTNIPQPKAVRVVDALAGVRRRDAEERLGKMKKLILAVMTVVAVLNVQSATHAKVQLWEGGPYWATTNIGADKPEDYGLYF